MTRALRIPGYKGCSVKVWYLAKLEVRTGCGVGGGVELGVSIYKDSYKGFIWVQ